MDVKRSVDVVVVGAGASGLRLAGSLIQAGISTVVLEGRDRVGGRLFSVKPGVDLGATWFWHNEHDVLEVIAECGLEVFPQYAAGNMMFQVPGNVQELDGNPLDQQAFRIVGGMASLAHGLAAKLPKGTVQLSTCVLSIDFAHEHVSVTTNSDTYRAKHVVIAVPPATALSNIVFTPDLPKELVNVAARTPVWMGAVTKVVALYESPFWREQGLSGSAMSHVGPLREIHDISDRSASFGALFGFSRERVSDMSVKSQLAALFGPRAGMPKSILVEDWSESPLTSPPGVFQLNDYQLFGSRVLRQDHCKGMLYFASTETSTDSPGHVQGAFAAARRTFRLLTGLPSDLL